MKTLDFCIDIETLSKEPDAAIINIACVPFSRDGSVDTSGTNPFEGYIHPMTAICSGLRVDSDTAGWWASRPPELKMVMSTNIATVGGSATAILEEFCIYIEHTKEALSPDRVRFWAQGKDFDFPILANALNKCCVIGALPWRYDQLRCARDYILEGVEEIFGPQADPYSKLPPYEPQTGGQPHLAAYDALRTAFNVTEVWKLKQQRNRI